MEWSEEKLNDVSKVITGNTPPTSDRLNYGDEVPFVTPVDLDKGVVYDAKSYLSSKGAAYGRLIPVDSVMVCCIGSIGKIGLAGKDVCTNQQINSLIFDKRKILPRYGFYYLSFIRKTLVQMADNAVVPLLNKTRFSNILIRYPSIVEQEKIVDCLYRLDILLEKRRQSLAKLDQLAQSIFLDMFGDPVTNPKNWPIKFLDEISTKITDGTHDTYETLNTGIKFITGKNIRPFHLDLSNLEYVSKENHREIYARCNPEYGDVLFTNIGAGVGTAVFNYLAEEFSMKNVALIKPRKELINGRYLESLLNIPYYKQFILDSNQQGGAQKFLSLKQIRTQKVIVPPIKLQDRFLYRIEKLYSLKEKAQVALISLETLQLSLSHRFFGEDT